MSVPRPLSNWQKESTVQELRELDPKTLDTYVFKLMRFEKVNNGFALWESGAQRVMAFL